MGRNTDRRTELEDGVFIEIRSRRCRNYNEFVEKSGKSPSSHFFIGETEFVGRFVAEMALDTKTNYLI
jgi:hypothetical protein